MSQPTKHVSVGLLSSHVQLMLTQQLTNISCMKMTPLSIWTFQEYGIGHWTNLAMLCTDARPTILGAMKKAIAFLLQLEVRFSIGCVYWKRLAWYITTAFSTFTYWLAANFLLKSCIYKDHWVLNWLWQMDTQNILLSRGYEWSNLLFTIASEVAD